jgi:lysozyme
MVSLAFNIGAAGYRSSTVLRRHRAGAYRAAADAFLLWDKAHVDGQLVTVAGLLNRRKAEMALYLT